MSLFFQNLLQSLRSVRKQAWQVAISSISLAVGIICITFNANWFWAETHYDHFRPGYKDLYFLQQHNKPEDKWWQNHISYNDFKAFKLHADGKGYRMGLYRGGWEKDFSTAPGGNTVSLRIMEMDTCVTELIGLRTLHGNIGEATGENRMHIAIFDKVAIRLFGRTDVVDEALFYEDNTMRMYMENGKFEQRPAGIKETYIIKAVVEAGKCEGNFDFDIIRTIDREYLNQLASAPSLTCLVSTKDIKGTVADLNSLRLPTEETKVERDLYPIRLAPRIPAVIHRGDNSYFLKIYLYNIIFIVVSLLLIVSAVVNLVMVYTSIYLSRLREYTLRHSMGASTRQNVCWMLTGILHTLLFALALAAMGTEWMVNLVDVTWDITYSWHFFIFSAIGTILLCLLGFIYPAVRMHRAYRDAVTGRAGGRGHSHRWLIVVQCMVCAFLLFLALGMQRQLNSVLNADMGYDHENMLRLHTGEKPKDYEKYHDFGALFLDLPGEFRKEAGAGITDAIALGTDIFNGQYGMSVYVVNVSEYQRLSNDLTSSKDVDFIGFKLLELPFRAMDFFNLRTENGGKLLATDEKSGEKQVFLNQEAMDLLNPDETYYMDRTGEYRTSMFEYHQENKWLFGSRLNIKDVVKLRTEDAFHVVPPIMFVGMDGSRKGDYLLHEAIYIKYAPGRRDEAEAAVRKVLARFDVPEERYMLTTFDEYIAAKYEKQIFIAQVLSLLTIFSTVITFAGIFSMLLYSLRLRRRSMAIHRIMGAELRDLLRSTLPSYLVFVILGGVVAYAPAAYFMGKWMESFVVGEAPGLGFMALIIAGMLLVVFLLVLWQVRRAMHEKPVEVLRPEA